MSPATHRLLSLGLLVAAAALWGFGIYAVASATPVTAPRRVAWHDAEGRPVEPGVVETPCIAADHSRLVLGDRVILTCEVGGVPGFAWLEPRSGTARLAWPMPPGMALGEVLGLAPREDGRFGVVFETAGEPQGSQEGRGSHDRIASQVTVALAGPDGWAVPPVVVGKHASDETAPPIAIGWIDGGVEIVLRHPGPDTDPYGYSHAPEVVRLEPGTAPRRAVHPWPAECEYPTFPPPAQCRVIAAIPGVHGWKLIVRKTDFGVELVESIVLVSEDGALAPAPAELAAWPERWLVDASAIGIVASGPRAALVMERDGTLHAAATTPHPSYSVDVPDGLALVNGVLRRRVMWREKEGHATAFVDGESALYVDDRDGLRVGVTPDHVAPVTRHAIWFSNAVVVPAPDGRYLVTNGGEYLALDRELRRADPLSLRAHLRAGWTGDDDAAWPLWRAGWFVLGLPILLGLSALRRRRVHDRRRRALAWVAFVYLATTLPMLRAFLASLA